MEREMEIMIEEIQQHAVEIARDDAHLPMLSLRIHGTWEVGFLPAGVLPRDAVPAILAQFQPDAYISVMEGRLLSAPREEMEDYLGDYEYGEIADNPDNPTVLILTAAERGEEVRVAMCEARTEAFPREFGAWRLMSGQKSGNLVIAEW